ncbi:uncharacterized protein PV09_04203 [Verruconis gallopava]|uniref:Uncharacterized protein n=1 Tax=Verruconis gallopava TaxID=253628 RepID=A0A0D2ADK0_9PEZI|nr:uncharacterized protein PV09_04203 [Verruconis gallopava]KIW05048.1 hypothetical protein PV09_04203 [Verruconis gallopava]
METISAICPHLQKERSIPPKTPNGYVPPFLAYAAQIPDEVKDMVMAIIGAQANADEANVFFALEIERFVSVVDAALRPRYWEWAAYTDSTGAYNQMTIAYWDSKSKYLKWTSQSGFTDCNEDNEGIAYMKNAMRGLILEHVYWGTLNRKSTRSGMHKLSGRMDRNAFAYPEDQILKKLYLEKMHPVLVKGMGFLWDNGPEVGCLSNRFMEILKPTNKKPCATKSFGLGYFDELASLERWSKEHKTHLNIFGKFLEYVKELQNDVSLRLFHEVLVLQSEQQEFECFCQLTTPDN